jgi:hypothetical protein
MKPGSHIALLALPIVAVALSWGCVNSDPPPASAAAGKKVFAVDVDSAAFYNNGPRPGSSPDRTLPKGTLVAMIRPSFGCCKVRLTTGEEGYVASDDLHFASTALIAEASAPPGHAVTAAHFSPDSVDSQFPAPVPAPDFEPTPIPIPLDLVN